MRTLNWRISEVYNIFSFNLENGRYFKIWEFFSLTDYSVLLNRYDTMFPDIKGQITKGLPNVNFFNVIRVNFSFESSS